MNHFEVDVGSGCIKALERMPHDREVMGLNPAGGWAFIFSYLPYQMRILYQVPRRGATLLIFLLAIQLEAKQA